MNQFTYTENINKELFGDDPSLMVELFTISGIANSSEEIRFHGGVNEIRKSIVFDNIEYFYIPYERSGFGNKSDGSMVRPSLRLINLGGFFSSYILDKDDLIGAQVTRTRTFLKFLDGINFYQYSTNPEFWKKKGVNPDPNSKLMDELWVINQKTSENKNAIEYELTSPLDLESARVPKRQIINNYCTWKYRGTGCPYAGKPISDGNDVLFGGGLTDKGEWEAETAYSENDFVSLNTEEAGSTRKVFYVCTEDHTSSKDDRPSINTKYWAMDACTKTLTACRRRFGEKPTAENNYGNAVKIKSLPFGGFPGSRLY
jgi:lambda family phage minor tail protein L